RPRVASAPSSGGVAHDVEEDLLVDDREILACGVLEELLRKEHESATVTGCVIGEKLEELLGHELRRAALLKKVSEKGDELLTSAWLEVDTHAHATCERHEVDALEAFGEAEIAREDDREEGPRIELVAREDAELLEDVRGSACSGASRTVIPVEAEQRFRRNPNGDSGGSRTAIPVKPNSRTLPDWQGRLWRDAGRSTRI